MLVKIIGTSTCDMMVAPMDSALPDIPGLCGIVPGSIIPGMYGLEAGQSAVGDIFNWFVKQLAPAAYTAKGDPHALLMGGMVMVGGGALLRKIDQLLTRETGVAVYVADAPMACVALGAGKALENYFVVKRSIPGL